VVSEHLHIAATGIGAVARQAVVDAVAVPRFTGAEVDLGVLDVGVDGVAPAVEPDVETLSTATSESLPAPVVCVPPNGRTHWVPYTVRRGDTLFSLAQDTQTTVTEVRQANCLSSNLIVAGKALYLPSIPVRPPTDTPSIPSATETPTQDTPVEDPTPTDTVESIPAPDPGDPKLTITPKSGPPGTVFTVNIENFKSNEAITVQVVFVSELDVVFETSTSVDDTGKATFIYTSQMDDRTGGYAVRVTGTESSASGSLKITEPGG